MLLIRSGVQKWLQLYEILVPAEKKFEFDYGHSCRPRPVSQRAWRGAGAGASLAVRPTRVRQDALCRARSCPAGSHARKRSRLVPSVRRARGPGGGRQSAVRRQHERAALAPVGQRLRRRSRRLAVGVGSVRWPRRRGASAHACAATGCSYHSGKP